MILFTYNQTVSFFMSDDVELTESLDLEDDTDEKDEIDEKDDDKVQHFRIDFESINSKFVSAKVAYLSILRSILVQKVPSPPPDLL